MLRRASVFFDEDRPRAESFRRLLDLLLFPLHQLLHREDLLAQRLRLPLRRRDPTLGDRVRSVGDLATLVRFGELLFRLRDLLAHDRHLARASVLVVQFRRRPAAPSGTAGTSRRAHPTVPRCSQAATRMPRGLWGNMLDVVVIRVLFEALLQRGERFDALRHRRTGYRMRGRAAADRRLG